MVDAREFANCVGRQRKWFVATHNFKQKFLLIRTCLCGIELDI
jgi:hypothetical protein